MGGQEYPTCPPKTLDLNEIGIITAIQRDAPHDLTDR